MKYTITIIFLSFCLVINAQDKTRKANINYEDFKQLVDKVEKIREKRLINLNEFLKFAKQKNTIILDTRSKEKYKSNHINGAINLPFTEFTEQSLSKVIPNKNTTILIYCNNNIYGDIFSFPSKTVQVNPINPSKSNEEEERKFSLALNIPTFINLYGYGYKNIYELEEYINIFDERIEFSGRQKVIKFGSLK